MKTVVAILCAVLLAGSAFADPYSIAKQQAKNVAGGQPPGVAPPTAPAPANPQPDPALQATLQNIASLRADFDRLGSNPTNLQPLINDLTVAAQGTKPSSTSVSTLAKSLAAALAGNDKLRGQAQRLAQYVHAIFNSSHLSAAQQQMICDAVQKILQDGGVSSDSVTSVINGIKTIATETR